MVQKHEAFLLILPMPLTAAEIVGGLLMLDRDRVSVAKATSSSPEADAYYAAKRLLEGGTVSVGSSRSPGKETVHGVNLRRADNSLEDPVSRLEVTTWSVPSRGFVEPDVPGVFGAPHLVAAELLPAVLATLRPQTEAIHGLLHPQLRSRLDLLDKGNAWSAYNDRAYLGGQRHLERQFLDWTREWYEKGEVCIPEEAFPHAYFAAGGTEALRGLLCSSYRRLHVLEGDHEAAEEVARAHGIPVTKHGRWNFQALADSAELLPGDAFYLTAPSAINGEYWSDLGEFLSLMDADHPAVHVIIDIRLIGLAQRLQPLDLADHPSVKAVVFSLSEAFGIPSERVGGVFTRQPQVCFDGDRFHSPRSIEIGRTLVQEFLSRGPAALAALWTPFQQEAFRLHQECGLLPPSATPANVVVLATAHEPPAMEAWYGLPLFRYDIGVHRFCLAPTMGRLAEAAAQAEKARHEETRKRLAKERGDLATAARAARIKRVEEVLEGIRAEFALSPEAAAAMADRLKPII